jgi:nucleoid-associated protein YgaU
MSCYFAPSRRAALLRRASASLGVVCLSLFAALGARAQDAPQDVAEAARQQRARKAARAETARAETHVYTNEDLQRSQILVEEDGARVAARKQNSAGTQAAAAQTKWPAAENGSALPVLPVGDAANDADESLGAVAGRYRKEKIAREAMRASGDPAASHFKLEIPANSLAELAPRVAPGVAPRVVVSVAPHAANNVLPQVAAHVPFPVVRNIAPSPVVASQPGGAAKTVAGETPRRRDPFTRPAICLAPERLGGSNVVSALPTLASRALPKTTESSSTETRLVPLLNPAPAPFAHTVIGKPLAVGRLVGAPDLGSPVGAEERVTMRAGDSLWGLSRRYLGSGVSWREWLVRNPGLNDARSLRIGTILVVPRPQDASPSLAVERAETRMIVVRKGDSLWKIAAERYGDGARWSCLALANPGLADAKWIYPGQRLTVPAACVGGVLHLSANGATAQ